MSLLCVVHRVNRLFVLMEPDEVIDYTIHDFGDELRNRGHWQDVVFDCVGGREIETSAFKVLKSSGVFETVVGPQRYIGERKLSWWELSKIMGYIGYRMLSTFFVGPRYIFGEKYPRKVIDSALSEVVKHGIRMPVQAVIPFELSSIVDAVRLLVRHRAKGRIVIDFNQSTGV